MVTGDDYMSSYIYLKYEYNSFGVFFCKTWSLHCVHWYYSGGGLDNSDIELGTIPSVVVVATLYIK